MDEYVEVITSKGVLWKLKKDGGRNDSEEREEPASIEQMEEFARHGDVVAMVVFLGAVVGIISGATSACIAIIIRSSLLRASPSAPPEWLIDEVVLLFWMAFTLTTCAQVSTILVHAKIGRLIASNQ